MHFQNCHSREFCIGEYLNKNKSFVFYVGLILKHAKYKTQVRTNNVLERNYFKDIYIYIHTHTHIHTYGHTRLKRLI